MSCLTLRTKSPPDISSSAMTSASSSPAAPLWARSAKPGAGERVIEQVRAKALGHEEVALVVDPRQLLAGVGEGPSVDVAPRFEDPQHPVELAGEGLGTAAHPTLEAAQLLLQSLGAFSGPEVGAQ